MTDEDQKTDLKIYRRLLGYVYPYWIAFVISIFGFLLYSLANVSFLQLVGYIVNSLEPGRVQADTEVTQYFSRFLGDPENLNRMLIPAAIVVIATVRGFGGFIGNYFISLVSNNLVHDLRCELFNRLLTLPSAFYDGHSMGHLVAKVTFHVTQVTGAATDAVRVIIREGFTVIGYVGLLLFLNWKLTLVFFAVAPVIGLLVSYAGKRFRRISERIQNSMGDVTHVASEAVQGYREVRTFGGSDYERGRFEKVSQDNRRQSMKMVVTSAIATPVIQILVAIALGVLVWLVLDPVFLKDMDPGDVVIFITTGGLLAKPIRQLSEVNATVQKGLAAAEDIFDLFDEPVEEDSGQHRVERVRGEVEFRNVEFSYNGSSRVLSGVSFKVSPGETVALVGRSGSGKSTLVSLIPRFYSPNSGEILIDGMPIDSFALDNLRDQIAIVSQQVTLFNDTVQRNIGYGKLQHADKADIKAAAERAYAWSFIETLENGLDTVVGDDGVLLSGGQRQRLAIARAFLKDAPILILDEATSSLDTESERYIQAALEAVVQGRTTFIIAHRLSTIEKADRIFVIDEGRIVEEGTHESLLSAKGFYAQLHARDEITFDPGATSTLTPGKTRPGSGAITNTQQIVDAWYNDAFWVKAFTPVAYLYQLIASLRKKWLRNGRTWQPPVPLIVVGNITVGGTGKSPLVIALVRHLQSLGLRPGVVSRGYGGEYDEYPLEVTQSSSTTEVGDEPFMIFKRTGCPVVVDPDRVDAVKYLLSEHDCDVVVSDDGLQHYAMGRTIEIAVVDGQRGLGNGLCLPAGPLREPPSRLEEVDLVVVNGIASGVSNPLSGVNPKTIVNMTLKPSMLINVMTGQTLAAEELAGRTVHAVAGISNPDRFFRTLEELGCQTVPHQYPDHYRFRAEDVIFDDDLMVVMTEKDAVKLERQALNRDLYWYLEVDAILDLPVIDSILGKAGLLSASKGKPARDEKTY